MDAASSHVVTVFAFTNQSGAPCEMNGFPSFEVRDSNDRPVPVAIKHTSGYMLRDDPPSEVTLPPNGEAFFGVQWTDICPVGTGGGDPTSYGRVAAGPPGESPAAAAAAVADVAPERLALCPDRALGVGPVRAGDALITW
jgi:hypothetical protein